MSTPSTSLAQPFIFKPTRSQQAFLEDVLSFFDTATVNVAIARPTFDGTLWVLVSADDTAIATCEVTTNGTVAVYQLIDFYNGWTTANRLDNIIGSRSASLNAVVYSPTAAQCRAVETIEQRYPTSTTYVRHPDTRHPTEDSNSIIIEFMLDDAAFYSYTIDTEGDIVAANMLTEFAAGWHRLSPRELTAELAPDA